jgi:peptidyl-prolyl cis-trans isomerase-like 4
MHSSTVCNPLGVKQNGHLSIPGITVAKDFLAQVGDPTATGTGGEGILSYIAAQSDHPEGVPRYFAPNMVPRLKHTTKGTVSMAVAPALEGQKGGCGSQFFITLADNVDYLDGKHAVFGHVVEGLEVLDQINEAFVDENGRPLKDIRIRHVVVLGKSALPFAGACTEH